MTKVFHTITLWAASLALVLAAATAQATVIYTFSGLCLDCPRIPIGTAALELDAGNALTRENFVSFSYSSTNFTYDVDSEALVSIDGALTGLPGPAEVHLVWNRFNNGILETHTFDSSVSGSWSVDPAPNDIGILGVWVGPAATPEPGSLALLLLGLAGLGASRRLRC